MDLFDIYKRTKKQRSAISQDVKKSIDSNNDLMSLFATFSGAKEEGTSANDSALFDDGMMLRTTAGVAPEILEKVNDREESRQLAEQAYQELVDKYGDSIDDIPELKIQKDALETIIKNPDLEPNENYAKALDELVNMAVGGSSKEELASEGLVVGDKEAYQEGKGFFDYSLGESTPMTELQEAQAGMDTGNLIDALWQGTNALADTVLAPWRENDKERKEERIETSRMHQASRPTQFVEEKSKEYYDKYGVVGGIKEMAKDLFENYGVSGVVRMVSEATVESLPAMIAAVGALAATKNPSTAISLLGSAGLGDYLAGKSREIYDEQKEKDWTKAITGGVLSGALDVVGAEALAGGTILRRILGKRAGEEVAKKLGEKGAAETAALFGAGVLGDAGIEVTTENLQNFLEEYGKTGNIEEAIQKAKEQAVGTTIETAGMSVPLAAMSPEGARKFHSEKMDMIGTAKKEQEQEKINQYKNAVEGIEPPQSIEEIKIAERKVAPTIQYIRANPEGKEEAISHLESHLKEIGKNDDEIEYTINSVLDAAEKLGPIYKDENGGSVNNIEMPETEEAEEEDVDINDLEARIKSDTGIIGTHELEHAMKLVDEGKYTPEEVVQKIANENDKEVFKEVYAIEPPKQSGSVPTDEVAQNIKNDLLRRWNKFKTAQNAQDKAKRLFDVAFRMPTIAFKKIDPKFVPSIDTKLVKRIVSQAKNTNEAKALVEKHNIKNPVLRNIIIELTAEKAIRDRMLSELKKEKENGTIDISDDDIVNIRKDSNKVIEHIIDNLHNPMKSEHTDFENHTREILAKIYKQKKGEIGRGIAKVSEIAKLKKPKQDIDQEIADIENDIKTLKKVGMIDEAKKLEVKKQRLLKEIEQKNKAPKLQQEIGKLKEIEKSLKHKEAKQEIRKKIEQLEAQFSEPKQAATKDATKTENKKRRYRLESGHIVSVDDSKVVLNIDGKNINLNDEKELIGNKKHLEKAGLVKKLNEDEEHIYTITQSGLMKKVLTRKGEHYSRAGETDENKAKKQEKAFVSSKIKRINEKGEAAKIDDIEVTNKEIKRIMSDWDVRPTIGKAEDRIIMRLSSKNLKTKYGEIRIQNPIADLLSIKNKNGEPAIGNLDKPLKDAMALVYRKIATFNPDYKRLVDVFGDGARPVFEAILENGVPLFAIKEEAKNIVGKVKFENGLSLFDISKKVVSDTDYLDDSFAQHLTSIAVKALVHKGFVRESKVEINGKQQAFYEIMENRSELLDRANELFDELRIESEIREPEPPGMGRASSKTEIGKVEKGTAQEEIFTAIKNMSRVKFKFNDEIGSESNKYAKMFFEHIKDKDIADMFVDEAPTLTTRVNKEIARENIERMYKRIKETYSKQKEMSFSWKIYSNWRAGITSNTINYQLEKISRGLVSPEKSITYINGTTERELKKNMEKFLFDRNGNLKDVPLKVLAFNMGIKIDRLDNDTIREQFSKMFEITPDGVVPRKGFKQAFRFAKNGLVLGMDMWKSKSSDKAALKKIAKEHEKVMTITALRDIALMDAVLRGEIKPYKVKGNVALYAKMEIDASTSASILSRLLNGTTYAKSKDIMMAGGVVLDIKSIPEALKGSGLLLKGTKKITDIYILANEKLARIIEKDNSLAARLIRQFNRDNMKKAIQEIEYGAGEKEFKHQLAREAFKILEKYIGESKSKAFATLMALKPYFPDARIVYIRNGKEESKKLKDITSLDGIDNKDISIENLHAPLLKLFEKTITKKQFEQFVREIMPTRLVLQELTNIIGKIVEAKRKNANPKWKTIKDLKESAKKEIGYIGFYNLGVFPFRISNEDAAKTSFVLPVVDKSEIKFAKKTVPYIEDRASKLLASMTHSIDSLVFFRSLNNTKAYDRLQYIYDAAIIGYDEQTLNDFSMEYNKNVIEETAKNSHIVEFSKYILENYNKELLSKNDLMKVKKALLWSKKAKTKLFEKIDAMQHFVYSPLGKNDELFAYKPDDKKKLIEDIGKSYDQVLNHQLLKDIDIAEKKKNTEKDVRSKSIELGESIRKTLLGEEILDNDGLAKYLRQMVSEKDEYANHLIDIVETLEDNLIGNEVIKLVKYKGDKFSLGSIQKDGDMYTIEVVLSDKDIVTSDIEVFTHELLHIVIDNTLPLSQEHKLKIKKAINTTIKALQEKYGKGNEWMAFLPKQYNDEDVEVAKSVAAYALFGEGTTKHEHEFLIYALTNKNFIENIKDIDIDLRLFKKDKSSSYLDDLINIVKELLNKLIGLVRKNNMKANEYAVKLYNELADAYYRIGNGASTRYAFMPKAARIVAKIDSITSLMRKESDKYAKPLMNLATKLAVEPAVKVMEQIWKETEIYRDMIDNEQSRAFFQIFKLNKDVMEKDFYRIKSIAQAAKESAKEKVDAVYGTRLKELLKNFTPKEREALNMIIASSGLYGLDLKDKDELVELIKNRKSEIEKLESVINDDGVKSQIEGLVVLKTEGKVVNHRQMLNAYAIHKQLFRDKTKSKIPEAIIYKLITLKILDRIDDIERIVEKDAGAIFRTYKFYKNMEKIFRKKNELNPLHEIHGYIKTKPKPFETVAWVKTNEIPKGATVLGGSVRVKGENYVRVKIKDYTQSYTQGALGIKNLSHMGTTFSADEIVTAKDHYQGEGYALLPILSDKGKIIGWRLNDIGRPKGDITENMAYTISDMFLRDKTSEYNKKVIDLLFRDYLINEGKRKYIEISPESHSELWMMIPKQTRNYLASKYGERKLFVRPELMYDIFGYQDPYLFKNHRALAWMQKIVKDIVEMAKMKMTVLNVDTIMSNAQSNYDTLIKYGMDPIDAARRMKEAWFLADQYEEDYLESLNMYFDMASGKPINLKEYKYRLRSKEENPISIIYKEGMMTPVIDDINVIEADNKNEIRRMIEDKFLTKLNEKMRKAVKSAYPTEETQAFKIGMKLFQRGDMVAKYALYTWLREQGIPYREAIETADEAFVNYSITEHPVLKYASDVGALIFNKYLFLAWKGMARMMKLAPGRFIGTEAAQGFKKGYEEATDLYLHRSLQDIVEPRILSPMEAGKTLFQPVFMA